MRSDWRGPSSSSTINSVRLRGLLAAGGDATGLEGVSKGDSDGMADKLIATVSESAECPAHVAGRTVGQLIRCIPAQMLILHSGANAEDMTVRIGNCRVET